MRTYVYSNCNLVNQTLPIPAGLLFVAWEWEPFLTVCDITKAWTADGWTLVYETVASGSNGVYVCMYMHNVPFL